MGLGDGRTQRQSFWGWKGKKKKNIGIKISIPRVEVATFHFAPKGDFIDTGVTTKRGVDSHGEKKRGKGVSRTPKVQQL